MRDFHHFLLLLLPTFLHHQQNSLSHTHFQSDNYMFMEDDGVDPFHVRQQNRRHKLRLIHHHHQNNQQQPPPSPPTFQLTQTQTDHHPSSPLTTTTTTTTANPYFHPHPHPPTPNPEPSRTSINYSSLPSLSIKNPNSIHHMNNTFPVDQFHYPPQCFNGDGAVSVSFIKPHDSTTTTGGHDNQGCLSLSLSSSSQYYCYNHNQNQLNSQRYAAVSERIVFPRPPPCNETSRSSFPLGPFTGYASILSRSRFLKPAQQLLDDFGAVDRGIIIMNSPLESSSDNGNIKDPINTTDGFETHRWESSRLVLLLDEAISFLPKSCGTASFSIYLRADAWFVWFANPAKVERESFITRKVYKRYKLYCQQMQSVVASFEAVAGLGNAAPYISFAFKSMAKHFTCLKNAIVDQIQLTGRTNLGYDGLRKDEIPPLWTAGQGYENHKPVQNSVFPPHPVWRSQRGLPDRAVAVLKKWLFEHFLHPYPSDSEKQILAHQTGLSRNQVSNWFINARVRLWKPMVEEIHMLETRQAQGSPEAVNRNANQPIDHLQSTPSLPSDTPYQITPTQKSQYIEHESNRDELSHTTTGLIDQQINSSHSNLSAIHLAGVSRIRTDESNGVSLALGLYQNNGIELSMPFPMNIAHHFGLETDSKVYMRNGF